MQENAKYFAICCGGLFCLGLLFYRNIVFAFVLVLLSIPIRKYWIGVKISKRKEKLLEGFRDVLYSISGSVASGRQLPYALEDAYGIVAKVYGEESDIGMEMQGIVSVSRESNADPVDMLIDFGERSQLEEIKQFAQACRICRKSGGDIESVCLKSSKLLLDRIDFQNEIKTLISEKKTDILLLSLMPIAILVFLNLTNFAYISVLYSSLWGKLVMSFCLALMGAAVVWGMKIVNLHL